MAKKFDLHCYIKSGIDRIWNWWPPRKEVIVAATVYLEDGTEAQKCIKCNTICSVVKIGKRRKRGVQVDHIDPVISVEHGFQGWDIYITRKFVPKEKLQVLCLKCHRKKSNAENQRRRDNGKV